MALVVPSNLKTRTVKVPVHHDNRVVSKAWTPEFEQGMEQIDWGHEEHCVKNSRER